MSNKTDQIEATTARPPNTVTLTIDGLQVTVPKGTNVLEAAKTLGIDISAFCYHPGLSIAACCRQCLVKVEKMGKLQPSCQTLCADEMVVETTDSESTEARQQMLEFTLVNHPIDCPICDKAGECTLQQLYFDHDNLPSRVNTPKVRKPKVVDLGPHIVLDAERCILCTRCIRVCDEVAQDHQLEMSNRGDHQILGTAPGADLDNPYSINTVDVCPVGALTAKDFRFTLRAWELMMTPSVCTGCATGCNIEVHHRNERVWRLQPRHNPEVNDYWMCDEGRFTYHPLREDRLAGPTVDGLPSSWSKAMDAAADKLLEVLERGRDQVGVVFSAQHTNEANYVLAKLARDHWQLERFYLGGKEPVPDRADDILRDADVNPNRAGVISILGSDPRSAAALAEDLASGALRGLLVLGHDLLLDEEALEAAAKLEVLVTIAGSEVGLVERAHVAFPSSAWAETNGTITNRKGMVQRLHAAVASPGQAIAAWEVITRLAQACDAAMDYGHAKDVFVEMIGAVEAFDGAQWGRHALPVQLRWAHSRG